jgi:Mg2+ and Co2+ transporter CorA
VDVWYVSAGQVERHGADDLADLRRRDDGILWVDVPHWDDATERALSEAFAFHPLALRDCANRNPIPKIHVYGDHVFVVLHAPETGVAGHVHFVELDQFVGPGYVVSVHGPLNPSVDPESATREVRTVLKRIESGRWSPTSADELSYALVTALTRRLREHIAGLTEQVWALEKQVTAGHLGDPEEFLEKMFRTRHGLLSTRTIAALSHEVYGRLATVWVAAPDRKRLCEDVVDQFERLRIMADGQKDYLQGTIEFYQARTNTKMTIAAERLAVIAAVTLPITALSSILGMNVIVNDSTHYGLLAAALVIMLVMSALLLLWAKRKGWW